MVRQKLKILKKKIRKLYRTYFTAEDSQKSLLSDKKFLEKLYEMKMGRKLDLKNPQSFSEKLQWLKLYDRKPEYTVMVDKYAAKQYVADIIGEEHIIPTLGLYDSPDDIDFDKLPDQFVLKCTHNSGIGNCICTDKSQLDIEKVKFELQKGLDHDYYLGEREWPYKNVPRRIVCEKYIADEFGSELNDYKFFCFYGKVKCFKVDFDRFVEHHANWYDRTGKLLPYGEVICPPVPDKRIDLPNELPKMIELAEELSENIPFLRVDFYCVNGRIYFGELTFYPASGLLKYTHEEWDKQLGDWLKLPKKKIR